MRHIIFFFFILAQCYTFAQSINLNGNLGNVSSCNSGFYDSGGSSNSYQNNESYSITIYPTNGGNVQIAFTSFVTENMYDTLNIYNGPDSINSPLIGTYQGNLNPFIVTASNPLGCLTLVWKTDMSVILAGWEAVVSCTAPYMQVSANIQPTACNASNGAISTNIVGGISPYTYAWSNGATSPSLTGLGAGPYILNVMDSTGATLTDTFYVNSGNLTINPTITDAACDSSGGAISLSITGGTVPYNISWNNGQTGTNLSNLAAGGYSLSMTDSNGCFAYWAGMVSVHDTCYGVISGHVYNDINGNCVQDAGENSVQYGFVNITPGGGTFTDVNGYYEFTVPTGTYTLQYYAGQFMGASACAAGGGLIQTYTLTSTNNNINNLDFPLQFMTIQDLSVSMYEGGYAPNWNHSTQIHVENEGSIAVAPTVVWQHADVITPTTYSVAPTTYDPITRTATWNLPSLASLSSQNITITSLTDSTAILGDSVNSRAQVFPFVGDADTTNNEAAHMGVVAASFDPNQKTAYPIGEGAYHFIAPDEQTLYYTIDFQNTGTFPATFVTIRDTLDFNLDNFSVEPLLASHNYTVDLINDNILVFHFDNINLPDSFSNEPESHGFVTFKIKIKDNLPLGTQLHNTAAIYFDFNEPVITNTTLHTIYTAPTIQNQQGGIVCENDYITISVEKGVPPYTYSWSNGTVLNNDMTGLVDFLFLGITGFYTVSVTDSFGVVSNIDSTYIEGVPLDASFSINIVGDTLFFIPNNMSIGSPYWDFGNGQTSTDWLPYIIITESEYQVSLNIATMCAMVDSWQTIYTTLATSEDLHGSISLSPNPMADNAVLQVSFPTQKPYSVELSDITGKVLRKWDNITSQSLNIEREGLAAGTYFIKVKGEKELTQKLMIK